MSTPVNDTTFDDFEDDDGPDDAEALREFAAELTAAVEAFNVPVLEPGGD